MSVSVVGGRTPEGEIGEAREGRGIGLAASERACPLGVEPS